MKKLLFFLLIFCIFSTENIYAKEIETFDRREENRYGIPDRYELTENRIKRAMNIPYINSSSKVYDFSKLLEEEEEEQLKKYAQKLSSFQNNSIVVVTISDLNSNSPREYADDFFDYNEFGTDGIILLICLNSRDVYISTSGYGQIIFDEKRIDSILENIAPKLSNQKYFEAIEYFLQEVENNLKQGSSHSMKHCNIINAYGDYRCKKEIPYLWILPICFIISLFITWICTRKYQKIRLATDAKIYLKKEEITLGKKIDKFLHTSTSRIPLPTNTSSNHGSKTHHGSSGSSHGGNGRKF